MRRGCHRQVKLGYLHCCLECSGTPNEIEHKHGYGCEQKNEQRENALSSKICLYRQNKVKRNADIEYAKRPKTDDHHWGAGTSSGSQWQHYSAHTDTPADQTMRESHNKPITKLIPVGVQSSVQPPATPITPTLTPITPITHLVSWNQNHLPLHNRYLQH